MLKYFAFNRLPDFHREHALFSEPTMATCEYNEHLYAEYYLASDGAWMTEWLSTVIQYGLSNRFCDSIGANKTNLN